MSTEPSHPPLNRIPRRADAFMVPRPLEGTVGQFVVDATWGAIRPMQLAPGVRTIGELEVLAHIQRGMALVDSRLPDYYAAGTIPSAVNIPHTQTTDRLDDFDAGSETVLFCNGPQCAATPDAIAQLLVAGYPSERILYYRGGMHDWLTLGLPTEVPTGAG